MNTNLMALGEELVKTIAANREQAIKWKSINALISDSVVVDMQDALVLTQL